MSIIEWLFKKKKKTIDITESFEEKVLNFVKNDPLSMMMMKLLADGIEQMEKEGSVEIKLIRDTCDCQTTILIKEISKDHFGDYIKGKIYDEEEITERYCYIYEESYFSEQDNTEYHSVVVRGAERNNEKGYEMRRLFIFDIYSSRYESKNDLLLNTCESFFDMSKECEINDRITAIQNDEIIQMNKRGATLLRPYRVSEGVSLSISKMCGEPNMFLYKEWPCCQFCGKNMGMVIQLYKKDFPEFYFPDQTDFFVLFHCLTWECDGYRMQHDEADHYNYWKYGAVHDDYRALPKDLEDDEKCVEYECLLDPLRYDEYSLQDLKSEDFENLAKKYGEKYINKFSKNHTLKIGTRLNGHPNYIQDGEILICRCGNKKEFLLQISSEEKEARIYGKQEDGSFIWSSHNICFGDLGNCYFFICKKCGPSTIEVFEDCY